MSGCSSYFVLSLFFLFWSMMFSGQKSHWLCIYLPLHKKSIREDKQGSSQRFAVGAARREIPIEYKETVFFMRVVCNAGVDMLRCFQALRLLLPGVRRQCWMTPRGLHMKPTWWQPHTEAAYWSKVTCIGIFSYFGKKSLCVVQAFFAVFRCSCRSVHGIMDFQSKYHYS